MKGFRQLRYIADLKALIAPNRWRKQSSGFMRERLAKYFEALATEHHNDFITVALNNQLVLSAFNTSSICSSFYIERVKESEVPPALILRAFAKFCTSNSEAINEFYQLRTKIESNLVVRNIDESLRLLDQVDKLYGKSIWSLDVRMNIYANAEYIDLGKSFAEEMSKDPEVKHIAALIYRKYQASSLASYHNQVLRNLLHEYRSNSLSRYADLLSIFLVPDFIDEEVDLSGLILLTQRLTPIDKLMLINKVSVRAMYSNEINESLKTELIKFSKGMNEYLKRGGWENICSYSEGLLSPRMGDEIQTAIKKYSSGNYDGAISLCSALIDSYPTDMTPMDITARSTIYTTDVENIEDLESGKISLTSQIFGFLLTTLHSSDNYEFIVDSCETLFFKYLNFEFISSVKPMLYAAYPHKCREKLSRSCVELFCSDFQISPKYVRILSDDSAALDVKDTLIEVDDLTHSRALRARIESLIEQDTIRRENVNDLLEELKKQSDILESEYWALWYRAKLESNQLDDIVITVSMLLISSDNNQHYFPLDEIVSLMESQREKYTQDIHSVILYYKYFRLQSFESKEYMSEFFEDFLLHNRVELASEFAETLSDLNPAEIFFLKDVCNPEIMGILLPISSNEELLFERFKILQIIVKNCPEFTEVLEIEEFRIFEKLYVDMLSLEHATNKIDINVNGIKKAKFSEYESFHDLLSEFKDDVPEDLLTLFEASKEDGLTKVDSAILHFYGRAYETVLDDFIFNEDFGLVRYLSSEIRHGWLPNQIRSVVESHNLVTELGADQSYEKSRHWHEVYELTVTPAFLERLDELFARFSSQVDALINTANSWPEVTRDPNNRKVAFNFSYDIDELKSFQSFTSSANSAEEFFELCSEFVWSKLDDCFRVMRNLINKELKPAFNSLFDELYANINSLGAELTQIKNEISVAKNKTIDEICIIEGWFCRPAANDIGSVSLDTVFKVAIANTKGIFNPRDIAIDLPEMPFNREIEGSKMLSIVRALVTAFQNSIIHGVRADDFDIQISFEVGKGTEEIIIENSVDDSGYQKAIDSGVTERVKNYSKDDATELLTQEGGTGLYKIFRFVQDFSSEATFRVCVYPDKFMQVITL